MIEEIKKELKEGRKVKVEKRDANNFMVDESKFKRDLYLRDFNADGEIVLTRTTSNGFTIDNSSYQIPFIEIHHFKIKESEPTFDDLIDVTVKAWKDGCLKVLKLEKGIVNQVFTVIDGITYRWHDGDDDYSHAIDTIKSLYTETFVIESEGDLHSIAKDNEMVLLNGEIVKFKGLSKEDSDVKMYLFYYDSFKYIVSMPFIALKGATVTQKREVNNEQI